MTRRFLFPLLMGLVLLMGVFGSGLDNSAKASTVNLNGSIAAGTLSIAVPNGLSFPGNETGGNLIFPNTAAEGQSITVTDATGSGGGWNVSAYSTGPFSCSSYPCSNQNLASNALYLTGSTSNPSSTTAPVDSCTATSDCIVSSNPAVSYPITIPDSSANSAVIANAAASTGLGQENISGLGWWLNVAGGTNPGTYSTNVVISVSSGPGNLTGATGSPQIVGQPQVGALLSATTGTWSNSPTFTYQWQYSPTSSGTYSNIPGATSANYTVASAYGGDYIEVQVTATNAINSSSAASSPLGPIINVPTNTTLPAVSGTPLVGNPLSVSTGSWTYSPSSYAYQWEYATSANGVYNAISGATSSTYTVGSSYAGDYLKAVVTATNPVGSTNASTVATTVVDEIPANTTLPAISGTAQTGDALTASSGEWAGYPDPTYSYQWMYAPTASGSYSNISGATSSSYNVASTYAGDYIEVAVTATNGSGSSIVASAPTSQIYQGPFSSSVPTISGNVAIGNTLTVTNGTWLAYPSPTYSYQWYDCTSSSGTGCTAIGGATASTYMLGDSDYGEYIEATVKATNSAGSNSAQSSTTVVVPGITPTFTEDPTISGTPQVGDILTAAAAASGYPAPSLSYEWFDCTAATGGTCTVVANNGSSSTYTLQASDAGAYMAVSIVATNAVAQISATSATTAAVGEGPVNTTLPTITDATNTGSYNVGDSLTANHGTWGAYPSPSYTYQWEYATTSGGAYGNISGATAATYVISSTYGGDYIKLLATATNTYGAANATSSPTTQIQGAPANTTLPIISGTPAEGNVLTATAGSWTDSPTSYAYQWEDCAAASGGTCAAISGATASTYTVQNTDLFSYIEVIVTAANAAGSATAPSTHESSSVAGPTLPTGMGMGPGEQLVSPNGAYSLIVTTGGNIELLNSSSQITWQSNTSGPTPTLLMQDDGNLVLYDASGPIWASNTNTGGNYYTTLSNNGTFAVYNSSGTAQITFGDYANVVASNSAVPYDWWTFSSISGSTFANSESGSNGAMTVESGAAANANALPGDYRGGSISLNGAANTGACSAVPTSNVSGTWTDLTWVYLTSLPSNSDDELLYARGTGAGYAYDMQLLNAYSSYTTPSGLHTDIGTLSSWLSTSADGATTFTTGNWYEVAEEENGSSYSIYVNGSEIGSGTLSGSNGDVVNTNALFCVGDNWAGGPATVIGDIANTAIYTSDLPASTLSSFYQAGMNYPANR